MKYLSWLAILKPTFWKVFDTFVVFVLLLVSLAPLLALGIPFVLDSFLAIPDFIGRLVGFSIQFSVWDSPGDGHPGLDIICIAIIDFLVLYILVCLVIEIVKVVYLSRKANKTKK